MTSRLKELAWWTQTWKWGCFLPCSQKEAEFQEAMNVLSTWASVPSIHVWNRGTCSHFKKNPDLKHLRSNSVYISQDVTGTGPERLTWLDKN